MFDSLLSSEVLVVFNIQSLNAGINLLNRRFSVETIVTSKR